MILMVAFNAQNVAGNIKIMNWQTIPQRISGLNTVTRSKSF